MTGKCVIYPGITTGNEATEFLYDYEAVQKILERQHSITKEFRESDSASKLKKLLNHKTDSLII